MTTETKPESVKEAVSPKFPGLLGKKIGMTQIFNESGMVTPVTVLEAGPCPILQVKSLKTDGYNAVQLGFGDGKKKRASLPMQGHFKKVGLDIPKRLIREFRFPDGPEGENEVSKFKPGDQIKVDIFEGDWKVDVTGITKGRGFTGMVKRWNKKRGPASHGSMNVRGPGSIADNPRLTHIRPGRHMAGHYGVERVTVKNLEVVRVDKERNLLLVKGAVPGANRSWVMIYRTGFVKPVPKMPAKPPKKVEPRAKQAKPVAKAKPPKK